MVGSNINKPNRWV